MARKAVAFSVLTLLLSCALLGCGSSGQGSASPATTPLSLNGNWSIAGSRQLNQLPLIVVSLTVNGSEIDAQGDAVVPCTTALGLASAGGNFELSGQIAADGSFTLAPVFGGSIQIAIQGKAPVAGSSVWSGSYTLTDVTSPCTQQVSSSFTATALTAVSGVYAGTLSAATSTSQTTPVTVSATLTQGAPATVASQSGDHHYLPLSGSITVTGSPCVTHGVVNSSAVNEIFGDLTVVHFTMDDGSQVLMNGTFTNQDESASRTFFNIIGGQCSLTSYAGTLTRQ